jgi:hypothetical protein
MVQVLGEAQYEWSKRPDEHSVNDNVEKIELTGVNKISGVN